jgi:AcrR family transcriptional regulator
MSPRQPDPDRALEVERQIVEAARDILAEGGMGGLSMRLVADRVGLSATALYNYFENKDGLVRRVIEDAFRQFGGYLADAAAPHPRGSLDRVQALGEAYIRFATEYTAYFRVLFSIQQDDPRTLEDIPDEGGFGLLQEAVGDAIAAGKMQPVDPGLMALYCWCVAHGVMTIALACRIDHCAEGRETTLPTDPLELFRAFRPLMRDGIAVPVPIAVADREGVEV